MSTSVDTRQIQQRLKSLESHLKAENPVLLQVVQSFRQLDRVAHSMGLLERSESYATRVPWWPMISVLGLYSSGKSTFINHYLGYTLQQTGNQAVDDKFTVVCYGADEVPRTLPGLSLDADPRFPFYQISHDIDEVAEGEGRRVDAYLQLKTCPSERLRGKIIIDSPGFDADAQRTSTLRITDHIVDLSDLVLVFFDARHPEPGAMHDTLEHLVTDTIQRPDSNKFLYILNQIDSTAREDNPEEVFAAWQRALAQRGLTAGRFFRIYNPDAATPIDDPARRARFEAKRDADLAEIHGRMHQVEVERAYRIIGVMEKTAKRIEEVLVPALTAARARWKRRVLWTDGIVFGLVLALLVALTIHQGWWDGLAFRPPGLQWLAGQSPWVAGGILGGGLLLVLAAAGGLHLKIRQWTANAIARDLEANAATPEDADALGKAFRFNAAPWRLLLPQRPAGWSGRTAKRLAQVMSDADRYVQALNDQFTNPSGRAGKPARGKPRLDTPPPDPTPEPAVGAAEAPQETPREAPGTQVPETTPGEPGDEARGRD